MLRIYTSNSLRELSEAIAADFIRHPLPPHEPDTVIVQSESLAFWLRLRLAEYLGCAAGLQMLFPGTLCQKLTISDSPVPSQEHLNWQIFNILGDSEFIGQYGVLKRYLQDNDPVKRLQFSLRLGSLFNNYLIFRHAMLLDWENGREGSSETACWQADLWRRLAGAPRANDFRQMLQNMTPDILPSRLSAFAPSTLPPLFLEFLQRAADFIPVNIYAVSPTPHFWSDVLSKRELLRRGEDTDMLDSTPASRLLASLGRQGREFFYNLSELDASGQAREELDYPEPQTDTLLGAVQQRIYHIGLEPLDFVLRENDASLIINNCHSPLREVEVLHEWVLDILAKSPELQPSDILVLVSQLDDYAPWIRAVFGSCPFLGRSFRISDRAPTAQEEFEQALLALLNIPRSRFESSRILELLDYEPIRQGSGLSHEEIRTLTTAVVELNIRWGIDAEQQRQATSAPLDGLNSWEKGLNRLLMGFATGIVDTPACGILPYCSELSRDTAAKFCIWFSALTDFCRMGRNPHTLKEWQLQINNICRNMLGGTYSENLSEDDPSTQLFGEFPDTEEVVSLQTLHYFLEDKFSRGGGSAFLGGGINFCSLKPLRSVPFEIIGVLGLGYEQFPRRERREQFNLLKEKHIPGDPSSRDDDRQLFMETLLSARQKLILSYCGQSQKDLGISPPSVCVSELLDFIEEEFGGDVSKGLTLQQPLQPFSNRYYDNTDPKLFSYSPEVCVNTVKSMNISEGRMSIANKTVQGDLHVGETDTTVYELTELIRFFKNPARYYSQNILGLRIPYEEPAPQDVEALGEDRHEIRQLRHTILQYPHANAAELSLRLAEMGVIPAAANGEMLLKNELNNLEQLRVMAAELPAPQHMVLALNLPNGETVQGTVDNLYPHGRRIIIPDKLSVYSEIELWLTHLLLCCADKSEVQKFPACTRVYTPEDSLQINPIENARDILQVICSLMQTGNIQPLPFFPRSSRAYAEQEFKLSQPKSRSRRPAIELARDLWQGNIRMRGEREDAYFNMCFKNIDPLESLSFSEVATVFWSNYFPCCEEIS